MRIRSATGADIDDIMRIYAVGRQTMRSNGNESQWVNGYPSRELIEADIEQGSSFVVVDDDGMPHGVFMFAIGDDPTYHVIEGGNWLNDEAYGVIHRIASDGEARGLLAKAVEFASERIGNLRIDTHEDNAIMRHALEKIGFARCGTIYCEDGTPRIAFHLSR